MLQIMNKVFLPGKRFYNLLKPVVSNKSTNLNISSLTKWNLTNLCQTWHHQTPSVSYNLLQNPKIKSLTNNIQSRSVIKFSMDKGTRLSDKDVIKRFYRLRWGIWIRTIAGRHKNLWKKRNRRRKRYLQHVFCNSTQSTLLDKMAGRYWKKPRYYVDDPYEPYHSREEFWITSKKPKPFIPPEYQTDNIK